MPGWHQPETVLELLINKDRWDALNDRERGLIDGACLATLPRRSTDSAKLQPDALADLAKDGVRIEHLSAEDAGAFRAAWTEVAKEEGDQDYFFKEVLDDIEKFRAKSQSPAPQAAPNASAEPGAPAETKATP